MNSNALGSKLGCYNIVNESTLRLVFDWVGSVNETTSNRVARLNKMATKICVGYQQEGIDPPPPLLV